MNAAKFQRHYIDLRDFEVDNISKNITNRMNHYVELSKALFRCGYSSKGRTFNTCFAVKKNKVLAIGINDYTRIMPEYSHLLGIKYKQFGEESYHPCLHAEMSSIMKIGSDNCWGLSFFNVRIDNNGNHCNSQPCRNCYNVLKSFGVKNIYYFNDDLKLCYV